MAGFSTIVPTDDVTLDTNNQLAAQNTQAYQQFNDAVDQHAQALDTQALFQRYSDGIDQHLAAQPFLNEPDVTQTQDNQPAPPVPDDQPPVPDDSLDSAVPADGQGSSPANPDAVSPYSFEGFSQAVDQGLAAAQQPPAAAGDTTDGAGGPASGQPDVHAIAGDPLRAYARQQAAANGLDPDLFERQIDAESGFNPDAQSTAGAQGIAQFMPGTAQGLGIDPTNPQQALAGAAKLMAQYKQRYDGDMSKALAAYNAGPGAVDAAGGVPNIPETQNYVAKIMTGAQSANPTALLNQGASGSSINPAAAAVPATAAAIQAGARPADLAWAQSHLGAAAYVGLCEKFVENASGQTGVYPTAIAAWNAQKGQASTDFKNIQPGDAIYFSANDSNNGDGHTGIYAGNGQFVSATDNGVRQLNIADWQKATGQQLLGYVPRGASQQGEPLTMGANQPVGQAAIPTAMPDTGAGGQGIPDTSTPGATALLNNGARAVDPGPSPSDQQTPIAQYNQQAPDGSFQQVTKMASGDYNAVPAAQPTPDQQTVYDAQNAATSGFTTPDVGAPLLASGATADVVPPAPGTDTSPPLADTSTPGATALLNNGARQDVAGQPQPGGLDLGKIGGLFHQLGDALGGASQQVANTPVGPQGQTVGDLLPQVAEKIGGLTNNAVTNSGAGQLVGQLLGPSGGDILSGSMPEPSDEDVQSAIAAANASGDTALAKQLAGYQATNKFLDAVALAGTSGTPEALAHGLAAARGVGAAEAAGDVGRAVEAATEAAPAAEVAAAAGGAAPATGPLAMPAVRPESALGQGINGSLYYPTTTNDAMDVLRRSGNSPEISGTDLLAAAQGGDIHAPATDLAVTPKGSILDQPMNKRGAVIEFGDPSAVDVKRLGSQPRDSFNPTFRITNAPATSSIKSVTFGQAPSTAVRQQLADMGFEGETLPGGKIQYVNSAFGSSDGRTLVPPAPRSDYEARATVPITSTGAVLNGADRMASPGQAVDAAATKAIDAATSPASAPAAAVPAATGHIDLGAATPGALRQPQMVTTPAAGPALAQRVNGSIGLLDAVGKALPKGAPLPEAANALSRGDHAITVLGAGVHDAIAKVGLTPEQDLEVARLREGTIPASSVDPKVVDVANATDNLAKASWQAANKAGAQDGYLEGYYSHLARQKAGGVAQGASFTPAQLSSFTRFGLSRGLDADGNILLPTMDDYVAFMAANHPDLVPITSAATVAEAHLVGLAKAANHAAVMDFVRSIADESTGRPVLLTDTERGRLAAQDPRVADYLRQGYRQVDLPPSMSRPVYRGQAPSAGTIMVGRRGVAGDGGGEAVLEQQPMVWVRNDVADLLDRYSRQDSPLTTSPVLNAYKTANALIVGDKMMNPVVHPLNVISDALASLPRAVGNNAWAGYKAGGLAGAARGAAGTPGAWVADWAKTRAITHDPVQMAQFLQEHDAALPVISRYARELAARVGPMEGPATPVLTGLKNAAANVRDLNHHVVFEGVVQPFLVHDILQYERQGYSAAEASAIASIKYAGIKPEELRGFQRWVSGMGTFAPSWTNGTIAEASSAIAGRRGLTAGGYGFKLTAAQQTKVAGALRADYLSGQGLNFAVTAVMNHALSGHWPWQNEQGRWLDVDTGQKDGQGNEVYLTNPLFKRQTDLLRLAAVPGTPLAAGEGTNTVTALAGKASPVLGAGAALTVPALDTSNPKQTTLRVGSQYVAPSNTAVAGGPPVYGAGTGNVGPIPASKEAWLQAASFLANQILPSSTSSKMDAHDAAGTKLAKPVLTIKAPGGFSYREGQGVSGPTLGGSTNVAAGVLGAVANVRTPSGAAYQDVQQAGAADLNKAYGPDVVKLFADAQVPLFTAPSTASTHGGAIDTTAAERQAWLAVKAATLKAELAQQGPLSNDPRTRFEQLSRLDSNANTVATGKIMQGQQARIYPTHGTPPNPLQFTAPAAR